MRKLRLELCKRRLPRWRHRLGGDALREVGRWRGRLRCAHRLPSQWLRHRDGCRHAVGHRRELRQWLRRHAGWQVLGVRQLGPRAGRVGAVCAPHRTGLLLLLLLLLLMMMMVMLLMLFHLLLLLLACVVEALGVVVRRVAHAVRLVREWRRRGVRRMLSLDDADDVVEDGADLRVEVRGEAFVERRGEERRGEERGAGAIWREMRSGACILRCDAVSARVGGDGCVGGWLWARGWRVGGDEVVPRRTQVNTAKSSEAYLCELVLFALLGLLEAQLVLDRLDEQALVTAGRGGALP
jgi:hypothetical protein